MNIRYPLMAKLSSDREDVAYLTDRLKRGDRGSAMVMGSMFSSLGALGGLHKFAPNLGGKARIAALGAAALGGALVGRHMGNEYTGYKPDTPTFKKKLIEAGKIAAASAGPALMVGGMDSLL